MAKSSSVYIYQLLKKKIIPQDIHSPKNIAQLSVTMLSQKLKVDKSVILYLEKAFVVVELVIFKLINSQ